MQKKVSVVTVCYNAEKDIVKTLESVLHLNYTDFEYIIVDGLSSDGTCNMIQTYLPLFEEKKVNVSFKSEKDNGIYDAMNKGIAAAQGEWIIFMNAGDVFADADVLKNVFAQGTYENVDVIYGNSNYITDGVEHLRKPSDIDKLYFYMVLCHQSVLTRTELCKKHKFDTTYCIAADYHMFLYFYINHYKFKYIDMTISDFATDGVSSIHPIKSHREDRRVRKAVIKKDKFILLRIAGETHVFLSRCMEAVRYRMLIRRK